MFPQGGSDENIIKLHYKVERMNLSPLFFFNIEDKVQRSLLSFLIQ